MRKFVQFLAFAGSLFFMAIAGCATHRTGLLDARISSAKKSEYISIRDGKDWRNPYLTVIADGVQIDVQGIESNRLVVGVNELKAALLSLPPEAWPYGRVVALQDTGILSQGDDGPIRNNHQAAESILRELRVEISFWPSA